MFKETISQLSLPDFSIREKISIFTCFIGLAVSVSGFYLLWAHENAVVTSQPLGAELLETNTQQVQTIIVDLGGAVKQPGIYSLQSEDRLAQAIEKAGGFADKADVMYIAQSLNLASSLEDGQKVYIPFTGELESNADKSSSATLESQSEISSSISINNAELSELDTLEGIGEKRAEDIISNRPYTTLDELVNKKVLTQNQFEQIKNKLKL